MASGDPKRKKTGNRPYRHINGLVGYREPDRDDFNFAELDRALTRWLIENDPTYRTGCVSTSFLDFDPN